MLNYRVPWTHVAGTAEQPLLMRHTHTHNNTKHARTATEPEAATTERDIGMATTEPEMATTEPEEANATTERETATNPKTGSRKRHSPPRRLHCLNLWPSDSREVPHTSRRSLRPTLSPERSHHRQFASYYEIISARFVSLSIAALKATMAAV